MPNLLEHARSELTQDALIAWFVAWARPACEDSHPGLHGAALKFLRELTSRQESNEPVREVAQVEVRSQWNNVDLLIVINGGEHLILVEDKAGTREHGNQLKDYQDTLEKAAEWSGADCTRHYIYLQTFEQSDWSAAGRDGYSVIRRADVISALRHAKELEPSLDNAIHADWLAYLENLDAAFERWRHEPLAAWQEDWHARQGFLQALQGDAAEGTWWYVANPNGGFLGYFLDGVDIEGVRHYVQVESHSKRTRLLVRVSSKTAKGTQEQRDERARCHARVIGAATRTGLCLKRPPRFGAGKTYTIAEFAASPLRREDGEPCGEEDRVCVNQTRKLIFELRAMLTELGGEPAKVQT